MMEHKLLDIALEEESIAVLLSGLYIASKNIHLYAIPPQCFMDVTKLILPYLREWDYEKHTFEGWIRDDLIIAPKMIFDEPERLKKNEFYFEKAYGNILLVATASMNGEDATII